MNCEEFKAIAASFVLSACDPKEQEAAEAHLRESKHDGCFEALSAANEAVVTLSRLDPAIRPSRQLWDRISQSIDGTDAAPAAGQSQKRASSLAYSGWAVAAGLALALGVTFNTASTRSAQDKQALTSMTDSLVTERATCAKNILDYKRDLQMQQKALDMLMAEAEMLPLVAQANAVGNVHALVGEDKHVMVIAHGMKAQPDQDYALWVIRGEKKMAAGLMKPNADGTVMMEVDAKLLDGKVDAFAVTLEPLGGGDTPRGSLMFVGSPRG
jgi:anti-sigma-K factor RskA